MKAAKKRSQMENEEAGDGEPEQKKLKLTTSDERKPPKYRRRKVAIMFAFCGVGYQGMQKNPGAKTIEGELEEALFHAGAVPEADRNKQRAYEWSRSARTDKGVSAVGQVVSGRFYVDPPGFVDRLNSHLPDQIRVFGYKRTAPSFSSKKFCDRRRYVYLIPVFALDPCSHSQAEMARSDSGFEYVKCIECCEKGYQIPLGVLGKDDTNSHSSCESLTSPENLSTFSYGDKEKERLNRILGYYVGSHNFHNFTTRTKAADPAANRYILSFNANTLINLHGKDFVKCEVVGQSFMLHQIRKMIGLAVAVMRNYAPESLIQNAFNKDVRINVPMAPEVGLYLDECFFTSYNKRFKGSHEELSMEEYKEAAEQFKWKHVYSHIGSAEDKDGAVAIWLHSLNQRNYPDLRNEHKPDDVIFYKKIEEASEEKIHEEQIAVKENTNGTAELRVVDKVNDEEFAVEESATG